MVIQCTRCGHTGVSVVEVFYRTVKYDDGTAERTRIVVYECNSCKTRFQKRPPQLYKNQR